MSRTDALLPLDGGTGHQNKPQKMFVLILQLKGSVLSGMIQSIMRKCLFLYVILPLDEKDRIFQINTHFSKRVFKSL